MIGRVITVGGRFLAGSGSITIVITAAMIGSQLCAAVNKASETEPDYTKGETIGSRYGGKSFNCSNFGSTGVVGNVWKGPAGQTARTIQVREVLKGSPADGILKVNDVILGLGETKFDTDVRVVMSAAITEAEAGKDDGKITLLVYRPEGDPKDGKGEEIAVDITVPIFGTYSDTAPWNCEKTAAIIQAACKNILDNGLYNEGKDGTKKIKGGIPTRLDVLGLLSTGEDKYLPLIKAYVRELSDSRKDTESGFHTWSIAYEMLLLTEYYLATNDEYVLPSIQNTAIRIARGASDVGTFSHGSAYEFTAHGKQWKYPSAYGAMNQCSITCAMSLVLARKCGVKSPELDEVIRKAAYFYRWYVDKGAIPYGDHPPGGGHDNNGVNSQSAVLFDLLGDKEAATYFTRTTLASYKIREGGHTGHFFSFQWGTLGAARGGDAAAQSFAKNIQWFTELERRPDGGFKYQPQLGNKDHGKYGNWSSTGSRLLQFCLPRKKLFITGKGGSCVEPIAGEELDEIVAAGVFDPKPLSIEQLLKKLESWSPTVRRQVAEELGEREDDVVKEMIAMLSGPDRYARYGACEGLSWAGRGSEEAIDALVKILEEDDDLTMRYFAATAFRKKRLWQPPPIRGWKTFENTLAKEGGAIEKAAPALLKQAAKYEPEKDPLRKLHAVIAATLFYGGSVANYTGCLPNGKGVESIDRKVLIPAIKSFLINPNGAARSTASSVYARLTEDDLKQLWGDIYYATKYQAPSGSMFAGGVRQNGLKLMVENGIEEGLPVAIDWALRQEGWGNGARKKGGIPLLLKYGSALEPFVLEMDQVMAGWTKEKKSKNNQEGAQDFKAKLEEALKKPAPELKSIKLYIDAAADPLQP